MAVARGESLEIYLDRFATNEPVTGATIEVESPGGPVKAAEGPDGPYGPRAQVLTVSRAEVFGAMVSPELRALIDYEARGSRR